MSRTLPEQAAGGCMVTAILAKLPMALSLALMALKLAGVITWSWWWVLSPIWLAIAVALLVIAWLGVPSTETGKT